MNAQMLLQSFAGGGDEKTYVDDVFSTYLYTGNGSTQTINNGIDLAGEGGLVWIKNRDRGAIGHYLFDTERGVQRYFALPSAQPSTFDNSYSSSLTSFNSSGFSVQSFNTSIDAACNKNGERFASWTFCKAPKFFDVQTISHTNGTATNIVLSSLETVGQVIAKTTNTTGEWITWHRSLTAGNNLRLNTTAGQTTTNAWLSVSGTTATLSASAPTGTYVVYGFAHNTEEDGMVQCGSFTTDASFNATVNLGWEPQYLMVKRADSATGGAWQLYDTMRGMDLSNSTQLQAQSSAADSGPFGSAVWPTSTGFAGDNTVFHPSATYIYLAIRRPNKPPKTGVEVYKTVLSYQTNTGTSVTGAGFPPDLNIALLRGASSLSQIMFDRLRGGLKYLSTSATSAEGSVTGDSFLQDGFYYGSASGESIANTFFRRAPGFFDVVCYTGTGVARTVNHNLGVAPELMIMKARSQAKAWMTYSAPTGAGMSLRINEISRAEVNTTYINNTVPTATVFSLGAGSSAGDDTNSGGTTFVAYLFATLPGISKVGSYTGNGTSLSVECGFSTGARFILVKSIDNAGDWFIWDTARGIIAENDPHLSLNTTTAEVTTDDSVDPYTGGFIVNQNTATNINISGKRYIFLAIA